MLLKERNLLVLIFVPLFGVFAGCGVKGNPSPYVDSVAPAASPAPVAVPTPTVTPRPAPMGKKKK